MAASDSKEIVSNSNVDRVELKEEEKKLSFTVEGETGTKGAAEVTIPKAMLSGEMMVFIDGQAVTPESNEVIVKSNTNADVTFEINYSHSEHRVDITGTTVAPEFPISALILAAATGGLVAITLAGTKAGFTGVFLQR